MQPTSSNNATRSMGKSLSSGGRLRTRTSQAHLADEHFPKLRQFVEAVASQELSYVRDARVVFDFEKCTDAFVAPAKTFLCEISVQPHSSELVAKEPSSLAAH